MSRRKPSGKCKICGTGFSKDPDKHFICRIIEEQGAKALKESYRETQRALEDLQPQNLVPSATEQIAAAFEVPPAIIGGGNITYRTSDSAEQLAAALRDAVRFNREIANSFEVNEDGTVSVKPSQKSAFEKNMKDIRDIRQLLADRTELDQQRCPTCEAEDRHYHATPGTSASSQYRHYGVRSRGGASG